METIEYKVVNTDGQTVGTVQLDASVYGVEANEVAVQQTVRWQLAKRRAGTHSTLTKGDMKGGGRKPWKQKGTGNARAGSNTSPLWVGGGVTHGPKPRNYEYKLPKSTRRLALTSVLSDKIRSGKVIILDDIAVEQGKTKEMIAILGRLGISDTKSVVILPELAGYEKTARAAGNLKKVSILPVVGLNVYDIMRNEVLVGTKRSIESIQDRLTGSDSSGECEAVHD